MFARGTREQKTRLDLPVTDFALVRTIETARSIEPGGTFGVRDKFATVPIFRVVLANLSGTAILRGRNLVDGGRTCTWLSRLSPADADRATEGTHLQAVALAGKLVNLWPRPAAPRVEGNRQLTGSNLHLPTSDTRWIPHRCRPQAI